MSGVNKQVRLKEETLKKIKCFKDTSKESYDEVINRILDDPREIIRKLDEIEANAKKEEEINLHHAWREFIPEMRKYFEECLKIINHDKQENLVLKPEPSFPKYETKEEIVKKTKKYYGLPLPPEPNKVIIPKP